MSSVSFPKSSEIYPPCFSSSEMEHDDEASSKPFISISSKDWKNPEAFLKKLPPKPEKLLNFLEGPCPIWGHKRCVAKDSHFVVPLIRNVTIIVNSSPVTEFLDLVNLDILDRASGGSGLKFSSYKNEILKTEKNKRYQVLFEWAVMTRTVLPGTRGMPFNVQEGITEDLGYEVPSVIDAATCILWEKRCSGSAFYNNNENLTFTRCREMIDDCYVEVGGGFSKRGLEIDLSVQEVFMTGMAGIKMFQDRFYSLKAKKPQACK